MCVDDEGVIKGADRKSCGGWGLSGAVRDGEGEVDVAVEVGVRSEGPAVSSVAGDGAGISKEVEDREGVPVSICAVDEELRSGDGEGVVFLNGAEINGGRAGVGAVVNGENGEGSGCCG